MSLRSSLTIIAGMILLVAVMVPVHAEKSGQSETGGYVANRDRAAIRDLLNAYQGSFNERDIDWRMSLCLDTYYEYGFENGEFLQVYDYDETRRETGNYWASIGEMDYSIDEIEITLDGPQAFVRAFTTHLAANDHHSSIVYFSLVKINGVWRIAWDSYNIVRRYQQ